MTEKIIKYILIGAVIVYAVSFLERFISQYTQQVKNGAYREALKEYEETKTRDEKAIFEDSVLIINSDRKVRDSLRAIHNPD